MKRLLLLTLVLLITGCGSQALNKNEFKDQTAEEGHFVEVVLPAEERSLGADITLSVTDREPIVLTVPEDHPLSPAPSVYFAVGETVAPATLEVRFTDGEIKRLEKVIFDTTLTLR